MIDAPMSPVGCQDVVSCAGSGYAASSAARLLSLAATPTFAVMAIWAGLIEPQHAIIRIAMQHASLVDGMALMYALMSIFHAAPWLKWLFRQRSEGSNPLAQAVIDQMKGNC